MSRSLLVLLLGLLVVTFAGPAQAEKRIALVVGISKYKQAPPLGNPVHDADAMGALFRKAGFDVVEEQRDLGVAGLRRAIREFSEKAEDADIAVVYYAGHGIEVDGLNYLVPADARLARDFDVEDEAVSLDRVLRSLDPVKWLRLVILDACRDNPFANTIKKSVASRSIGRGLAKVEPATPNTLVAFATRAGAVADDGHGDNSQYTSALVKYIAEPGVDVRVAFGRVRDEVLQRTGNRQEPFVYGSLGGDNLALVPQPAKPVDSDAAARIDYEHAAQLATKEVWNSFLARYPAGFYADLARAQVRKLASAEPSQAAAATAREGVEMVRRQAVDEVQQQADKAKGNAGGDDAKVAAVTPAQPEQTPASSTSQMSQTDITQHHDIERHRGREAPPRPRSMQRRVVRLMMPPDGFAPMSLPSARPSRSCTLDSSGHRENGRSCQVF